MANPRSIIFGGKQADWGTLSIKIKKLNDPAYWWDSTLNSGAGGFTTSEPSPHLEMSYDSDLEQYYIESIPTQAVIASIFDSSDVLVATEVWGGALPEVVDPGSASSYTMAEVLSRIRAAIRDPGGDNPLYSNAHLLNILDGCNDWILDQVSKKGCDLGAKRATYDGDGSTTEWDLPTDFYAAFNAPIWPNATHGGPLRKVTKAEYDKGELENMVVYPSYYCMFGGKIYFIPDPLSASQDIYLYYWGRNTKLESTSTVPWDGVFISLMVEWGKSVALRGDEFDATFEERMMQIFLRSAQSYLGNRSFRQTMMRVSSRDFNKVYGRRKRTR